MKIVVFSLGCKVNQVEGQSIINALKGLGFDATDRLERADAYVVNTCAVTAEAARKSRQMLSRCKAAGGGAPVYVCGCAGQDDSEFFLTGEDVRFVTGSGGKGGIAAKIAEDLALRCGDKFSDTALPLEYEDDLFPERTRTRAYIKIQDGCDSFCAYCIVPYLRGRSRSRAPESVLKEAIAAAQVCKEIVLTGINLSAYGGGGGLKDIILRLKGLPVRKRLGSLEAGVITEEFLDAAGDADFLQHFHLSLQSASDGVLAAMNRKYTIEEFKSKVRLIRERFPDAGITTDIIAGFPGETEEQHRETLENLKEIAFSGAHVFPYSLRKGTAAASMPQLTKEVKNRRAAEISAVTRETARRFVLDRAGIEYEVLFEERTAGGEYSGYTGNYIRVTRPSPRDISGETALIKITENDATCD